MPPRRRVARRAHPASDEEPEQRETERTEQSEVRQLRGQVAQMSETARRQEETARRQEEAARRLEENMDRMMRQFGQRVSPTVLPVASPAAASSIPVPIVSLTEEEQEDLTDRTQGQQPIDVSIPVLEECDTGLRRRRPTKGIPLRWWPAARIGGCGGDARESATIMDQPRFWLKPMKGSGQRHRGGVGAALMVAGDKRR